MKSKSALKYQAVRHNVQEYFTKNPKRKSVVITNEIKGIKTFWKVKKLAEGKFSITEVNAIKESYILEDEKTSVLGKPTFNADDKPEETQDQIMGKLHQVAGRGNMNRQQQNDFMQKASEKDNQNHANFNNAAEKTAGQIYQWHPLNPGKDSDFNKSLETKGLDQTLRAMPDNVVQQFFKQNKAQLLKNPQRAQTVSQAIQQHNPGGAYLVKKAAGLPEGKVQKKKLTESVEFDNIRSKFADILTNKASQNVSNYNGILTKAKSTLTQLTDPNEKKLLQAIISALNDLVSSASSSTSTISQQTTLQQGRFSKKVRALREADKKDADAVEEEEHNKKAKDEKQTHDNRTQVDATSDDSEDNDNNNEKNAGDTVGDDDDAPENTEPNSIAAAETKQDQFISQRLKGQEIEDCHVSFGQDMTVVELSLVGVSSPVKFEISRDGKSKFVFKDRPLLLKKI